MESNPNDCLPRIADGLMGWRFLQWFQGRDVLIWRAPELVRKKPLIRISFQAPPLAIERFYARETIPNFEHQLDISLQRALGFEAKMGAGGYGVDSEHGQRLDEPDAVYIDVFRAVEDLVAALLEPCFGVLPYVQVNFIPVGGTPIVPYYSARKRAWQRAGTPPKTVEVEVVEEDDSGVPRTQKTLGVDLCSFYQRVSNCGPEILAVPRNTDATSTSVFHPKRNGGFMVMHSTMPTPSASKSVAACGGWLFASLGVGLIPSATFGPLCLFGSVGLVLAGLRPYREGRGNWPISVYDTDVWTMSSRHFPMASARLYRQITGTFDEDSAASHGSIEGHGSHQWILGAPTSTSSFGNIEAKRLETTKALASELAKRWGIWGWHGKKKDIEQLISQHSDSGARYPYMEAKSNGIIDANCWRLAVCSKSWVKQSKAYLRATGIKAPLLVVDDAPSTAKDHANGHVWHWSLGGSGDDETYDYSQQVAEAAVGYAFREGLVREYVL